MNQIVRTQQEIENQLDQARKTQWHSKYPGQSYEDGIVDFAMWLFGDTNDLPMPKDE